MRSSSLFLILLVCASASFAEEAPAEIELYPTDNGRMYLTDRGTLVAAVEEALRSARTRIVSESDDGLWITRPRRFPEKKFEGIGKLPETAGAQLHIWVPKGVQPARLYIGSIVWTESNTYYNFGQVERWFFTEIEKHLDASPMGIPIDSRVRADAIAEILGEGADTECLERYGKRQWATPLAGGLELVAPSKVVPLFPETAGVNREEGAVILQAMIGEDGAVHHTSILRSTSQDPNFIQSAVGAVMLWRYLPSRVEGCAVPAPITVVVEFELS